jgi:hypothetical protein
MDDNTTELEEIKELLKEILAELKGIRRYWE